MRRLALATLVDASLVMATSATADAERFPSTATETSTLVLIEEDRNAGVLRLVRERSAASTRQTADESVA